MLARASPHLARRSDFTMSAIPECRCRSWCAPKQDHSLDEYEDAFCGDSSRGRLAIADGASESAFAGTWAKMLVEHFVERELHPDNIDEWLAEVQSRWLAEVSDKPLPWYGEMKRDEGAFATFLGLEVFATEKSEACCWRAAAIGDACLFQIRADKLLSAFPLTQSGEFNNSPQLLCSRQPASESSHSPFQWQSGDLLKGDIFILMTDAMAEWFLRETEAGRSPWQETLVYAQNDADELTTAAAAEWLMALRKAGSIRNDDVTMVAIEI